MTSFRRLLMLNDEELEARGLRHTPFEISQQPGLWRTMLPGVLAFVDSLRNFLPKNRPIVLAGAGTSAYAAEAVETTLKKRGWSHVEAIGSTELILDPEALFPAEPFTLVSFARSGNSPEGNAAFSLASALRPDTRHIVITCNEDGELARLARNAGPDVARLFILPEEANDQGLAMTSSFSSMVLAGQALGHVDELSRFETDVLYIAQAAEHLMKNAADSIGELAKEPFKRAVFIGARNHYATALESHLKVQELSDGQVASAAQTLLGIRHGPMSAINKETIMCVFLSQDEYVRSYEMDLLRELRDKQLGMKTMACVPALGERGQSLEFAELVDVIVPVGVATESDTPEDDLWVAPMAIVGQILGLMKSVALGLKPDTPSADDVIHRVVQGVTIYPYKD